MSFPSIPTRRAICQGLHPSLLAAALSLSTLTPAHAQADPYIGQLMLVPYSFCPQGWAEAAGQLLPIAENNALFSLLGTTYGGNGVSNFALPDLRGRAPIGQGQGPGLTSHDLGENGGAESVKLTQNQMPMHTHGLQVSSQGASYSAPGSNRVLAAAQNAGTYVQATPDTTLSANSIGIAGGSQPFSVRDPYLTLRWCIALQGVYPSRP